jgi:hypothetical protein
MTAMRVSLKEDRLTVPGSGHWAHDGRSDACMARASHAW